MKNVQEAKQLFKQYSLEGLKMNPPFKGYGMKLVQFAFDYPEEYQMIVRNNQYQSQKEFLDDLFDGLPIIQVIQKTFDLNEKDSYWLYNHLWSYIEGIITIHQYDIYPISIEEIGMNLGALCRGLVMHLKAQDDERIKLIPQEDLKIQGDISEYIEGKKQTVIGYGEQREVYTIKLEAIFYFEAVGDKLFAYTRNRVFEIKKRLYQIEEMATIYSFIRISKSMVVNLKKIESISSISGGRGNILLSNGELVIVSRSYYRQVVDEIKKRS